MLWALSIIFTVTAVGVIVNLSKYVVPGEDGGDYQLGEFKALKF